MNKSFLGYFSKGELALWSASSFFILTSFFAFGEQDYLTLTASLIGVTSLILNAKGNPIGQLMMIIFSIFYGITSYSFAYYGEIITYLGMAAPIALAALISWLKNPYNKNRLQVKVGHLRRGEGVFLLLLTAAVTVIFYFILNHFNTANLIPSTLSVTTSFVASYLTFRRSPYFALTYAANDIILIVLWILVSFTDISYVSVVVCFIVFLLNDLYGFYSWLKMEKKQSANE